jgi:hypothetical protein
LTAATGGRIEDHRAKEILNFTTSLGRRVAIRISEGPIAAKILHLVCMRIEVQLILISDPMSGFAGSMYPPSTAGMS